MVRRCFIRCSRHADPNHSLFLLHHMTREDYERLDLNPRQDLASPLTALAFFSAALDLYRDELGAFADEIARTAAMMAFSDAQNGNWRHGMLVIMVIETVPGPDVHILPPRRTPHEVASILAMEDTNLAVSGGTDRSPPTAGIGVELTDFNGNSDSDSSDDSSDEDEDEEEEEEAARVGLSEGDISMLKKVELESVDNIDESCCVCLEEFKVEEVITPLSPCSHRFHNLCIVRWLRINGTCPICRSICKVD